jgi:3-isopropylmalate dehydratase small subunit
MEQGRIPEDVFDDLGFPCDKDVYGYEVLRAAGILQESYQRSKCLTHEFQIDLRKECIKQGENDQRHKVDQMQQKQNKEVDSIGLIEECYWT